MSEKDIKDLKAKVEENVYEENDEIVEGNCGCRSSSRRRCDTDCPFSTSLITCSK